jgi:FkbM family methyltransferase
MRFTRLKQAAFEAAKLLNKTQRMIRGARHVPDIFWLDCFTRHRYWCGGFRVNQRRELLIPGVAEPAPKRFANQLMHSMAIVRRIAKHGATFDFSRSDFATVSSNGIAMRIEGYTELATFEEVVVREFYRMNLRQPTVVIDIGMNVGLASLYFARDPNVVAVYGYEPFTPTYESAVANMALNQSLASKIVPINKGIDAVERSLDAMYVAAVNTSMGVSGMTTDSAGHNVEMQRIDLIAATDVFEEVRARYPNAAILIKIDCEGSEREIVPALCKLSAIRSSVMMNIETHDHCEGAVIDALSEAGFKVFATATDYDGVWLIHAVSGVDW